ncbi:MAG: LysM peptidoglycan-binding domain-containing protein, partial [Porticoccaceae bacterium]
MGSIALPALLLITALVSGCTNYSAPVTSLAQPPSIRIVTHQVVAGDTLYSIAWRYDLDYRLLGSANGLRPPYRLEIGQVLSLDTSGVKPIASAKATSRSAAKSAKKSVGSRVQEPLSKSAASYSKDLRWQWPVKGDIVEDYNPKQL